MPNSSKVEAIKDDDKESCSSLLQSYYKSREDDKEFEPVADSRKELTWDSDAIHRCEREFITNLYVLGSDDQTQIHCNKNTLPGH